MAEVGRVVEVDETTRPSQGTTLPDLAPREGSAPVYQYFCDRGLLQEGVGLPNLDCSSVLASQGLTHGDEGLQLPPTCFCRAGTRHPVALTQATHGLPHRLPGRKVVINFHMFRYHQDIAFITPAL